MSEIQSESGRPSAFPDPFSEKLNDNESPGDRIMEDDLTEERYPTPAERADVADDQPQDP